MHDLYRCTNGATGLDQRPLRPFTIHGNGSGLHKRGPYPDAHSPTLSCEIYQRRGGSGDRRRWRNWKVDCYETGQTWSTRCHLGYQQDWYISLGRHKGTSAFIIMIAGLEDTVQEIRRSGGKCWSYYCDITNRNEVYRIAKTVQIEVGPVTLLINNAGYVYGKTLMDLPDDEIERTYNVNILSHYWITKAFMRDMMKNNHGHIVTVASVAGLLGTYNCTDYSATKFAAIGYHESLFTELKAHGYDGIHATLVCPYFINTGMFHGVKPRLMPMLEPDYVAEEVVSGILVNQINVVLPGSVRYLLPLKCLLPAKLCWALMYHVIKGPQSMMMLKGREEKILKNNNNIFDAVISKETHVR
nr:PREDICTED: estradiol 17-beta-dehydrogenase 11-like isoform X1 [Megachile rotundata]